MSSTKKSNPESSARFYDFGPFRIDRLKRVLMRDGAPASLTPKAFDTLLLLVERRSQVLTKDELIKELWPDTFVEEGSLTRNISALRKALGERPQEHRYIVTIPGQGYRFVAKVITLYGETGNLFVPGQTRTKIIAAEQNEESAGPEIETARESPAIKGRDFGRAAKFSLRPAVWFSAILLVAIAATALVTYKLFTSGEKSEATRASTPPKLDIVRLTSTGNISNGRAAISPDARFVAYAVMDSAGRNSLWLKQLATHATEPLIPTSEIEYGGLTFSPDGNHIYYIARLKSDSRNALYRIPLIKGPPKKILDDLEGSISFSPDGSRFVFPRNQVARGEHILAVANADGSQEQQIASIKYPEFFGEPSWSPDGKVIASAAGHADGGANRYLIQISVDDWVVREVSSQRWRWVGPVEWLSDGSGLLMIAADQVGAPYQIWHLPYPNGEPSRVTNDTITYTRLSLNADSNALVALQLRQVTNIWVVPAEDPGRARRITFGSGGFRGNLVCLRDARIIFESSTDGYPDISIMKEDGSDQRHLLGDLTGRAAASSPTVPADGRYVFFSYDIEGARNIWRIGIDGRDPVRLTSGKGEDSLHCSPDGKWIVYTDIASSRPSVWKVPAGGGEPAQLTRASSKFGSVSPDGKLVACLYASEETGMEWRIALLSIDGGEPLKIFSQPAARVPSIKWSPDGRGVAYVDNLRDVSNIWIQPIDGSSPKQLTRFDTDQVFGFDWSPDGKNLVCTRGIWERNLVLIKNVK